MPRNPRAHVSVAALVLVLAALAPALPARADDPPDSVDLEIGPRARVHGSLRPSDEREAYFVRALRGTKVKATVRRSGGGGPVPALDLVDDALAAVAAGRATRTGASISRFAFAATAGHRFRVTGDGADGDYRLDVTLSPQTSWRTASPADLGPGEEATFAFAAPEGATATIDLRPARLSSFAPLLVDLTPPAGTAVPFDAGLATSGRHRASAVTGDAGEHVLRIRNAGAEKGGWTLSIRLAVPRSARVATDLRDDALGGAFDGPHAVLGRVIDDDAATAIDVPGGLGLDGASISVPAGAVSLPTLVTMTTSDPVFAGDDLNPAGATVEFAPAGTEFTIPASVTLPFDPDAFDDPANELSIVVESADGTQETIAASSVDTTNATATFPVSHFSRFQPVSPQPRPLRGRFAEVQLTGRTLAGFGAEFTLGFNAISVGKGPRAAGPGLRTVRRTSLGWRQTDGGAPELVAGTEDREDLAVTAAVSTNDAVVLRRIGDDLVLDRGRGRDALTAANTVGASVGLHAALRRTNGTATRANLAGGWHAAVFEVSASQREDGVIDVVLCAQDMDLDVARSGRAVASAVIRRTTTQRYPGGGFRHTADTRVPAPGRLDPDPEGAGERGVLLRMPLGRAKKPFEAQLMPVLRGDVLIGGASELSGGSPSTGGVLRFVMLVRRTAAARAADFAADSILTSFHVTAEDGGLDPASIRFGLRRGGLAVSPGGTATFGGVANLAGHDAQGAASTGSLPSSGAGGLIVKHDGRVETGDAAGRGFLPPHRAALLVFSPEAGTFRIGVGLPSRPGAGGE